MSKGTLMLNGVDYSNAGGGRSMVNYSTEEQVIGTWIDGKKLYQKTIIFNNITVPRATPTGFDTADIPWSVIDYLTVFTAFFANHNLDAYYAAWGHPQSNKTYMYQSFGGGDVTGIAYITYQYTKTTD